MSGARCLAHVVRVLLAMAALSATVSAHADEPRAVFDIGGRLTQFPGKTVTPCPAQTPRTLVLLIAGQSNTANYAEARHVSAHGDRVLNYFAGACTVAASPLLGTAGDRGESWTLLGNKIIAAGIADRVVLIPTGIGATAIRLWQQGGTLNPMLMQVVDEAQKRYRITHVLWHQGESDFADGTSKQAYRAGFSSLVESLRRHGVDAPIFPSVATRCPHGPVWYRANLTAEAQRSLPDRARGIFPGVDTDSLLGPADRDFGCHYTASGQEIFAAAWLDVLRKHAPRATAAGAQMRLARTIW